MMGDLSWFNEARYGMFIHWGPYSAAARGEWVLNRENIPYDEYINKYVNAFKAENFDPKSWARLARKAGMKYIVLTTRHHDGFALWDTETSDFNSAKMGPHKDLVRLFADAVREEGLKLGFYYSVADWRHPDYPGAYENYWPEKWKDEESRKRFVEYYYAQVEELMTNYSKVDLLWYDGCFPAPTDGEKINKHIKELQPHILINNRNGEPYDYKVCEQTIRPEKPGISWEACMTLNNFWGFHAGDPYYKPAREVIMLLVQTVARAGNLLLNVGPKADGTIPVEAENVLLEAGEWLRHNGEFLANSSFSTLPHDCYTSITTKENKLYLHIFYDVGSEFCLAGVKNTVVSARLTGSNQAVEFHQDGSRIHLKGIPPPMMGIATTIVLETEGQPEPIKRLNSDFLP